MLIEEEAVVGAMQGPQDAIRARITVRADHAHGEEDVEAALVEIEGELAADLGFDAQPGAEEDVCAPDEAAWGELTALHRWAPLASYACARFYAPAGTWPKNLAGWSHGVAACLQRLAHAISMRLQAVGDSLGAASVSVSVSYPWGLALVLNW
jgi:hypothetical protein